eukprot:TRINITY_DN30330_c0_g1_i1.p1 TRINITY_DN30330_c0_g1~~TRINITY_DN30330_c0_g1_i1.p1  ORF type:complete len:243 (+),score=43.69 TRINITY_DN30330_c0_g1_i1:45-731(+)
MAIHVMHESAMKFVQRERSETPSNEEGTMTREQFKEAAKMMEMGGWKYYDDGCYVVCERAKCRRRISEEPLDDASTNEEELEVEGSVESDDDAAAVNAVVGTQVDDANTRYYTIYIQYHGYYQVPTCYFIGYNSRLEPLSTKEMFEDVMQHKIVSGNHCEAAGDVWMMHIHACTHHKKLAELRPLNVKPEHHHRFAVASYIDYVSNHILPFVEIKHNFEFTRDYSKFV